MTTHRSACRTPIVVLSLIAALLLASASASPLALAATSAAAPGPSQGSAGVSAAGSASEVTLSALFDTQIVNTQPSGNYGASAELHVGLYGGSDYRILVRFDLSSIPPGSTVNSAILELKSFIPNAPPESALAGQAEAAEWRIWPYRIGMDWGEMDVTWSTPLGFDGLGDPSTDLNGQPASAWIPWSVLAIARSWITYGVPNYGIMLTGDGTTALISNFWSREGGSAPRLTINYTVPAATSTPSNTPAQSATPTRTKTPTRTRTATPTGTRTTAPTPTRTATSPTVATRSPTATKTMMPQPTSPSSCPEAVLVADQDTFTDQANPAAIEGASEYVVLARETGTYSYVYLHFPFEGVIQPDEYIYSAQIQMAVADMQGYPTGTWNLIGYGLAEPFDEATTTWLNQPSIQGSVVFGLVGRLYMSLDITEMARHWQSGEEANNGLVLMPLSTTDFRITYYSRHTSNPTFRPQLIIGCGSAAPTATPTRTATPTPTRTPTPTATLGPSLVNLKPRYVEVTQGLQDLENSIDLFEGKRTMVRVFAYAVEQGVPRNGYPTHAWLEVWRDGAKVTTMSSLPQDGLTYVQESPSRSDPGASFDFELPSYLIEGTITLKAQVNPGCLDGWGLAETNCLDNFIEQTVSFVEAPPLSVGLFSVEYYKPDGTLSDHPQYSSIMDQVRWMKQVFPVVGVDSFYQTWTISIPFSSSMVVPYFMDINHELAARVVWDVCNGAHSNFWSRSGVKAYAAFIIGYNDKIYGMADAIPGVASTSSTTKRKNIFAHELGHNMGRCHTWDPQYEAIACLDEEDCAKCEDYPYADGYISPVVDEWDPDAVMGLEFVEGGFNLMPPTTKDLMTWSPVIWPSKFTFERLLDILGGATAQQAEVPARLAVPREYLLVTGTIDPQTLETELSPLFVFSSDMAYQPQQGDYAIVLRDESRAELARYLFTPARMMDAILGQDPAQGDELLSVALAVPYNRSTAQVDVEGPGGRRLASVRAGMTLPEVTLHSPNGGEVLDGDPIRISWTARDRDDDPLTFNVDYSTDNGRTWQLIAQGITATSVQVAASSLAGTDHGRMRVWASDGIHTASDASDGWFTVPNRPPVVEIVQPEEGRMAVAGDTVFFEALAYDPDMDSSADLDVQWRSDVDGVFGHGSEFGTDSLSVGTHLITAMADDGDGAVGADIVQVTVVASYEDLPAQLSKLWVAPDTVYLYPCSSLPRGSIFVHNSGPAEPIAWEASASQSWLRLSKTSGQTPDRVVVSADCEALEPGTHSATVTIKNSKLPKEHVEVEVVAVVQPTERIWLPILLK